MERYKISPEKSFEVLRRVSQDSNARVRDVAQHLVETGETPGR